MTTDECEVWSCGRPLRTNEQREMGLCGIHLAAQRKRDATDAKYKVKYAAESAALERCKTLADELEALTGIHFVHGAGQLALSESDAQRLLKRLQWVPRIYLTDESVERLPDKESSDG